MKLIKKIVPLIMVALVLSPIAAQATTTVTAGPLKDLNPATATIHIALSGFPTTSGLYIQQCNAPVPGARPTDCSPSQLWISTDAKATFAPTADIVFKPTATYSSKNGAIDCTVISCGLFIRKDHTAPPTDFSEDQFIPLTFTSGASVPTLPSDEITGTLNGVLLSSKTTTDLAYRAIGKLRTESKSGSLLSVISSTKDCTVEKGIITALKGTGFCNIEVTSPGNSTYAGSVARYPLKLISGTPFIGVKKFPTSLNVGAARAIVSETNFGSDVTYRASSAKICSIEGNLLLAKKKGTCQLQATSPAREGMWSALSQTVKIKIK
jgi:hypothetical protein